MSNKVEGGFALVKTLKDLEVTDIFTLAGGHINPIYNACREMGIRLIDTHHEQGASMAADAYGRVTKKPGVCLITAGPGLTNVITGMSGAFLSNSPCIFLSGKSGVEENDRPLFKKLIKNQWLSLLQNGQRQFMTQKNPEYTANAYKMAVSGRPGPVYLGLPHEVLYEKSDFDDFDIPQLTFPKTLKQQMMI